MVLDTEKRPRKSWVVWGEDGKYPNVIIEILSDSTAKVDRTDKKSLYQNTFRTPEYFWFHPETLEFQGFLMMGGQYQPIPPNAEGYLWSEQLGLYLGVYESKLRYFTPDGVLVPSPQESALEERRRANDERRRADEERLRANSERQRAEIAQNQLREERQRSELLAQKLRELGLNPDEI